MGELLIVNFHYVREEKYSSGIYPISIKDLLKQIDVLSKNHQFISQKELVKIIVERKSLDKKYCLITFDDGLKEQIEVFNLLQSKKIPAIFFVPTNAIKNRLVLDVHKLHFIRTKLDDIELFELLDHKCNISNFEFDNHLLINQYRYDTEKARKIKYFLNFVLSKKKKDDLVDYVFKNLVKNEHDFADKLYMEEIDVKTLSNSDSLGSHGSDHIPLSKIALEKAKEDIIKSVKYLENLTQSPIRSFSYPYGGIDAVDTTLGSLFKTTNIIFALTMWRGSNNTDNIKNPYFLKRLDTNDAPGGKLNSNNYG